jgi:hypothetical protein
LLLAVTAWLGGCTCAGSLRPLVSDETLAMAADLNGKWVGGDKNGDEEYFLIESTGGPAYRVTHVNKDEELKDVYDLSLVQVGGYMFFDGAFKEAANKETTKNTYDLGVLPIHLIGRIWVDGDTLRLGALDYDWMSQMTSSGSLKLSHLEQNQGDDRLILLTAESDELKEFVRQYAEDPGAFSTVTILHRVSPAVEPTTDSKR